MESKMKSEKKPEQCFLGPTPTAAGHPQLNKNRTIICYYQKEQMVNHLLPELPRLLMPTKNGNSHAITNY
jgi:hypothetical protein